MHNKTEIPELADTGKGFSVIYKDRHLYSGTEPDLKIQRIVTSLELKENTFYLLPSPLMFKGIEDLLGRMPSSSRMFCIEADENLAEFSKKYIPPGNIPYLRTRDNAFLLSILEGEDYSSLRKAELIILTGGYTLNRNYYDKALDEIRFFLNNFWKNKMTMIFMSRMWINNIFMNLASADNRNEKLSSFKTSRPVLVIGAGSSLEKKIEEIRRFRKKLFLLCVDTALPVLINSGIMPDAAVVVEAQHYNLYDFLDIRETEQIILFYDFNCHYKVHSIFKGRKVPFISMFSELSFFNDLKKNSILPYELPALGSVGLAGLYLASIISNHPCGFIGLDFAYQLGKPHSRGTESHKRLLFSSERIANDDYTSANLSRSAKPYKNLAPDLRSDPVLYSYSIQCMQLLSRGNYADCGTEGLLDHQNKMEIAELADLPESVCESSEKIFTDKQKIVSFLEIKLETLDRAVSIMKETSFSWSSELRAIVKSDDYITADFPENDILCLDAGIVVPRILASAERYRKIIKKALIFTLENA